MVLFSGFGPADQVQESLKVGMGALAGSSALALSLAFGIMVLVGRVDLGEDGKAN